MNKKAQIDSGYESSGNALHALTLLVIAALMATSLYYLATNYVSKSVTTEVSTEKFFFIEATRHCFLYEENGRVNYDKINPLLINDSSLMNCLPNKEIKVILKDLNQNIIASAKTASFLSLETEGYEYNVNIPESNELYRFVVILG